EHAVGHLVEDLRQLGGMTLADCEDDRLADLPTDWIAQGVFHESLAEDLVGCTCEKTLLEFTLLESLLLILAFVIFEGDDETLFGKEFRGDFGSSIHHCRVDEESLFHPVQ